MTRLLERLLSKAAHRGPKDAESLVIAFFSWGAILLQAKGGPRPEVLRACKLALDASLTENERRNAFLGFLSSLGVKKSPSASLTWADGMMFRQLAMPDMPADDLQKAFAWELKKKFFYNPEENHFGFSEVMSVDGAEGPEKLFDVFYCEKKTASSKIAFAQSLGCDIRSLVPEQAAVAAYAGSDSPPPDGDTLVCEKDGASVRIVVARDRHAMLVRQLTVGTPEGDLTDETLGKIAEEIKKTVDFYEAQKYFRPVAKVMFVSFYDFERVQEFMARQLSLPVAVPQIDSFLSPSMPQPEKEIVLATASFFAAPIGAMMVREETMNLVPEDIKLIGRQKRISHSLNIALASFAGVLCLVALVMGVQANAMKSELRKLEKEHAAISEKKKAYETTLAREKVRRTVIKGTVDAPSFLKELSYRIPTQLTLEELRYNRADQSVVFKGEVSDTKREGAKSVTQFATNLAESIFMQSASVANTFVDEQGTLKFEVNGTVKGLL